MVRLARPAAFCAGRRSPLEVVFRAREDVFESVSFRLLCADREVASAVQRTRPGTSEKAVRLQVTPQSPGGAALELQVAVLADGASEPETQVVRFVIAVDEAQSRQTTLNLAPQFVSDRAGHNEVGTINLNVAGGAFGAASTDVSRYETLLPGEDVETELLASPPRLTLRAEDGRTIQLLSDEEVTFGRNRDNAVLSRIIGADGCLDYGANEGNLSRFHFKLVRRPEGAVVLDVGSSHGTRVDGTAVPVAGGLRLPSIRPSVIAAGCPGRELEYSVQPHKGALNGLAGLVLDRRDQAPERVVVVWGGRVPFADGAFRHDGGRWSFVRTAGETADLGVASLVNVGGIRMRVMPFHHPFA